MKFHLSLTLMLVVFLLTSCKKNMEAPSMEKKPIPVENVVFSQNRGLDTGLVVLGKKLDNPYSLENIKMSMTKLGSRAAEKKEIENLQPTHFYVRFLPKNSEELSLLYKDTTLIYSTIPVGYEIIKNGDYYHDPNIPKEQITWLYATVTTDYKFPNIRYEILEKLHKPIDEEVELYTLAYTGNIGNPSLTTEVRAAENLNTIMPKVISFWGGRKYNPSGRIYVEEIKRDGTSSYQPLRRAKVYVQYWFWNNTAFTNNDGYFRIGERYSKEVGVYLEHRDGLATVSGAWNEYAGIKVSDKIGNGRENFERKINKSHSHLWHKTSVHNALALYDDFATKHGFKRPNNVRTWVGLIGKSGMAPMINGKSTLFYTSLFEQNAINNVIQDGNINTTSNALTNYILYKLGGVATGGISQLASHLLPDIIIGRQENSQDYYETVAHELTHYSHYHNVGPNWWASVVYETLINGTNNPYGDGTKNYSGNRLTLAEAWAHHMAYHIVQEQRSDLPVTKDDNNVVIYSVPYTINQNFENWMPKNLFRDLIDSDENSIFHYNGKTGDFTKTYTDHVEGISPQQIYNLLNSNTNSLEDLKTKLITHYPEKNKNHEITELFEAYGY